MMSWEQLDKLNCIATDPAKSAKAKKSEIQDFMRMWSMLVHEGPDAWNYTPTWTDPNRPDIDPSTESVRARLPIPGQTGRTWYPGQ